MNSFLKSLATVSLSFMACICFAGSDALAQEPETIPPPLKVVSKDERSKLDQISDIKDRTKLAIEMMDLRLDAAELQFKARAYPDTFRELGAFHALLDEAFAVVRIRSDASGRVAESMRRLDFALRGFLPRLETIRRDLPYAYEEYVRNLIKYVRDARTRALDRLFSNDVVPNAGR